MFKYEVQNSGAFVVHTLNALFGLLPINILLVMRKKRPISARKLQDLLELQWKIMVSLFSFFGLLAYITCRSRVKLQPTSTVSILPRSFGYNHFEGTPKVAFLFLARRDLPWDFMWDAFFKDVDSANYSIHIHSEPGFEFNETTTRSAFFIGQQLNSSVHVGWGGSNIVEAARLLLETALQDPANQRFVLLSDSCVPIYNFSLIYSYLMSSTKSYIESFVDLDDRYNSKMSPTIPKEKWRKGSQWITLVRRHAAIIVQDYYVLPVFQKFCRLIPPLNVTKLQILQDFDLLQAFQSQDLLHIFKKRQICIPDEHYMQTLPLIYGIEDEIVRRTLTYTFWNESAPRGPGRWHPVAFNDADITPLKIREIKRINSVYYKSEHRTERCTVKDRFTHCHLFARKFTPSAALRLQKEGLVGL